MISQIFFPQSKLQPWAVSSQLHKGRNKSTLTAKYLLLPLTEREFLNLSCHHTYTPDPILYATQRILPYEPMWKMIPNSSSHSTKSIYTAFETINYQIVLSTLLSLGNTCFILPDSINSQVDLFKFAWGWGLSKGVPQSPHHSDLLYRHMVFPTSSILMTDSFIQWDLDDG